MTSIDTNVISALLEAEDALAIQAQDALETAAERGRLCVCLPVYAELIAKPKRSLETVNSFLSATRIELDTKFEPEIWTMAGLAFNRYATQHKKEKSLAPRRILADFLIGAHAQTHQLTLLTLDARVYKTFFPNLNVQTTGET
jgi:predicted nucleic acid-binding protein